MQRINWMPRNITEDNRKLQTKRHSNLGRDFKKCDSGRANKWPNIVSYRWWMETYSKIFCYMQPQNVSVKGKIRWRYLSATFSNMTAFGEVSDQRHTPADLTLAKQSRYRHNNGGTELFNMPSGIQNKWLKNEHHKETWEELHWWRKTWERE